jgi:acyl-coenzyme A thioesterase PaaI-like protein
MTEVNSNRAPNRVMRWWSTCGKLPAGRYLFSVALGLFIPYTRTIGARVVELQPGYARIELADRRRVRNHLNSIHAIALANIGELTTGLAVFSSTSEEMRGILTSIRVDYAKKARGKLVSHAEYRLPETITDDVPCEVEALIRDGTGDTVAAVRATWLIGYRRS